jgi:hypothetical protein
MLIFMKNMKNTYRLYKRKNGFFYLHDNDSGAQKSLDTKDSAEAKKLLNAENEARQNSTLNLQLGKVYLTQADPSLSKNLAGRNGRVGLPWH